MERGAPLWLFRILLASCVFLTSCAGIRSFPGKDPGRPDEGDSRASSSTVHYGQGVAVPGKTVQGNTAPQQDRQASVRPEEPRAATSVPEIRKRGAAGSGVRPEIPIENNEKVNYFLAYFQGPKRDWMLGTLQRSGRYVGPMREILRKEGLPEDLVYLALIESGYDPYACSSSGAIGIWQFMDHTGRRYGLRIDWWVDERRDLEKSTRAAARYLKDLYLLFNDWYLAAAAYNAGEGKIQRTILECGSDDFWQIAARGSIKDETREYVPKFLAALLIASDPQAYGFGQIPYDPPLLYETVLVADATDLTVLARACGQEVPLLRTLNPQFNRSYTPPLCELKVPRATAQRVKAYYARLDPSERVTFRQHVVKKGENLAAIARMYGIPAGTIADMNGLENTSRIRRGQSLTIPMTGPALHRKTGSGVATAEAADLYSSAAQAPERATYQVRRGDTLWRISQMHGVSLASLCAWNGISASSKIRPGQELVVRPGSAHGEEELRRHTGARTDQQRPPARSLQEAWHVVQRGDTLWRISRRYGVTLPELCRWNDLDVRHPLRPGATLRIYLDRNIYADIDVYGSRTIPD